MTVQSDIHPARIRRIREARDQSQTEFAQELGVPDTTVGKWERGEMRPGEEYIDAIRDRIPAGFDAEDVVDSIDHSTECEGWVSSPEHWVCGSEKLQLLREQPRTGDELPTDAEMNTVPGKQRQFVRQLTVGAQVGQYEEQGGQAATVYYLEGDERRAIRRYIEANEEIVADALSRQENRFQHEWSDFLYALLEEEWRFWLYR